MELDRNDICYCGSNKKFKNCHLKPFYPSDYFSSEIKGVDTVKFENRSPEHIAVGRVDVYYRDQYPWDDEISIILKPLTEINWDEKDRWQFRIKKRIDKLHHKLDAIKYHTHLFKNFERNTEESYKRYMIANTTMNKVHDDPHLIYNLESFLFQTKSCLDLFITLVKISL